MYRLIGQTPPPGAKHLHLVRWMSSHEPPAEASSSNWWYYKRGRERVSNCVRYSAAWPPLCLCSACKTSSMFYSQLLQLWDIKKLTKLNNKHKPSACGSTATDRGCDHLSKTYGFCFFDRLAQILHTVHPWVRISQCFCLPSGKEAIKQTVWKWKTDWTAEWSNP